MSFKPPESVFVTNCISKTMSLIEKILKSLHNFIAFEHNSMSVIKKPDN